MTKGVVSERHPVHAVVLARPKDAKHDTWIVAGIPVWRTYPCTCVLGKPCNTNLFGENPPCRCWGRTDVERFDHLPPHCCAARAHRLPRKDTPA